MLQLEICQSSTHAPEYIKPIITAIYDLFSSKWKNTCKLCTEALINETIKIITSHFYTMSVQGFLDITSIGLFRLHYLNYY